MSRLHTPEAADPFYRVRSELRKAHPSARLRYSNQFAKDIRQRAQSCPDGLQVNDFGDFKLELVRRHNPHTRRVCHIKGLNDVPVCVVRDDLNREWENRFIVSPSSFGLVYSNRPKKKLADYLLTDRSIKSNSSRSSSRLSVPKMSLIPPPNFEEDLTEELDSIQALDMLCSILQTNSLQTVQAWIDQATDEEREIVLRALKEMKEKGVLKSSGTFPKKDLSLLGDNAKSAVSYQNNWNQTQSVNTDLYNEVKKAVEQEIKEKKKPETAPPNLKTPSVGTQTPVSVILPRSRPPTRISMTGLSNNGSRPSTMRSVREKFLQSQMSKKPEAAAKDPGFSWTRKPKEAPADVATKA